MFSYEVGLFLAFILWLWITASAIASINSRMNRNLGKIGQRLSWMTLTPTPMTAEEANQTAIHKIMKFLLIYGLGLPFVLTSWVYVAYVIGLFVYRKCKDSGVPQAVREFRWKLRNTDMSFDQIVRELMKVSDQDPTTFEKVRADLVQELADRGIHVR